MENKNGVEQMGLFEMSRWGALMEGVNLIADECDERGIDFDTLNLEPLNLRKYVEGTCDKIYKKLEEEEEIERNRRKIAQKSYSEVLDEILEHIRLEKTANDLCHRP